MMEDDTQGLEYLDFRGLADEDCNVIKVLLKPKHLSQRKVKFPWDKTDLSRLEAEAAGLVNGGPASFEEAAAACHYGYPAAGEAVGVDHHYASAPHDQVVDNRTDAMVMHQSPPVVAHHRHMPLVPASDHHAAAAHNYRPGAADAKMATVAVPITAQMVIQVRGIPFQMPPDGGMCGVVLPAVPPPPLVPVHGLPPGAPPPLLHPVLPRHAMVRVGGLMPREMANSALSMLPPPAMVHYGQSLGGGMQAVGGEPVAPYNLAAHGGGGGGRAFAGACDQSPNPELAPVATAIGNAPAGEPISAATASVPAGQPVPATPASAPAGELVAVATASVPAGEHVAMTTASVPAGEQPSATRIGNSDGDDRSIERDAAMPSGCQSSDPRASRSEVSPDEEERAAGEKKEAGDVRDEKAPAVAAATEEAKQKLKPSSWASLFRNDNAKMVYVPLESEQLEAAAAESMAGRAPRRGSQAGSEAADDVVVVVKPSEDHGAMSLGEHLSRIKIIHKTVALHPRGMLNRANWCYINSTLQSLLACPPFYHLLKSLPIFPALTRGPSSTPIIDSFVEFVSAFHQMTVRTGIKGKRQQDLNPGSSFEPSYMYKMLGLIKSELCAKGRQEDAEEFLGCILNGLHEEMLAALNLYAGQDEAKPNGLSNGDLAASLDAIQVEGEEPGSQEEGDEDEWKRVGPKNKSSVTRSSANLAKTPISEIFGGQMRSELHTVGGRGSATLQPFFTLQLDIQSEKVHTLKDALDGLVKSEALSGFTCAKTKVEVEASRRMMLEQLPPVLILHLKCFVYDKSGGCQKVLKKIDYGIDLEIGKELLSQVGKAKIRENQRKYKLFAVLCHHGKNATGGHYTADVYHTGIGGWIRCDDDAIRPIAAMQVLKYVNPRQPYLLYYRRCDLM